MSSHTGIWTAIITPFDQNGESIQFDLFSKLIERQIQAGITGLVVAGSTGEGNCLRNEEFEELVTRAAQYRNDIQIMASCGQSATWRAIEWAKIAKRAGAHSLLVSTPAYNKPPQEALVSYFESVAKAAEGLPLMVYNIPGRTAVNLTPATLEKIWQIPGIQSLKESSGQWDQFLEMQQNCPPSREILCGDDPSSLAFWTHGAVGTVSVLSNLAPRWVVSQWKAFLDQNLIKARETFFKSLNLTRALFCESNPIPVKWAVASLLSVRMGMRPPLRDLSLESQARLRKEMEAAAAILEGEK